MNKFLCLVFLSCVVLGARANPKCSDNCHINMYDDRSTIDVQSNVGDALKNP